MEPPIKSEPCETLYSEGQEVVDQGRPEHSSNSKRSYGEMEGMSTNSLQNSADDFLHIPPHIQIKVLKLDKGATSSPNNSISDLNGGKVRRQKRIVTDVVLNPPFFNPPPISEPYCYKGAVSASCYTCGKVVKGNHGISSNFLKHLRRCRPEICKLFEDYKAHKILAEEFPKITQLLEARSKLGGISALDTDNIRLSGSDSNATLSCDETNQFLDINPLEITDNNDSSSGEEDILNGSTDLDQMSMSQKQQYQYSVKHLQPQAQNRCENQQHELSTLNLETINRLINEKTNEFVEQKFLPAMTEVKAELETLKKECTQLRLALQQTQASKRQLQTELQTVDKLLHQRKLIIRNLKINHDEQPLKSVEKLVHETLDLQNIKIVNCCIIPSTKSLPESNKVCLSIELDSPQSCKAIFRQSHKLKNTGIFIESEISPFQRKRKSKLMVLRKELLRRKSDLKVLVRDTTLVVNGKNFYWDDVEGLYHDCKYDAIDLNGVEYLNQISGLDLKEFINFLQNYNVDIR